MSSKPPILPVKADYLHHRRYFSAWRELISVTCILNVVADRPTQMMSLVKPETRMKHSSLGTSASPTVSSSVQRVLAELTSCGPELAHNLGMRAFHLGDSALTSSQNPLITARTSFTFQALPRNTSFASAASSVQHEHIRITVFLPCMLCRHLVSISTGMLSCIAMIMSVGFSVIRYNRSFHLMVQQ